MVNHYFKSLSPHSSHTISPLHSQCTWYFNKKIEVIVWKLFMPPCNSLQLQTATSINITFFPPILNDQESFLFKAKPAFDCIPSHRCWGFGHYFLFVLYLQLFLPCSLFLQPVYILQTCIQKSKSANKNKLTFLFTRFYGHYYSISVLSNPFRIFTQQSTFIISAF